MNVVSMNAMLIGYDGDCAFCSWWVRCILAYDTKQQFRFVSLSSTRGKTLLEGIEKKQNEHDAKALSNTVILLRGEEALIKFLAVQEIVKHLDGKARWFAWIPWIPLPLGNFVYDQIAKRRHLFGRGSLQCTLPDQAVQDRFL